MAQVEFIEDATVDSELDRQIRILLCACFTGPDDHSFRVQRYWREAPRWHWFVRGAADHLIGHVAVHDKQVGSTTGLVRIAGIGDVCVHPDHRGRGLVREMLAAAHTWLAGEQIPFGMLFGETNVYTSSGYTNAANPIRVWSPKQQIWVTTPPGKAMIKLLGNTPWPEGLIDLRGPLF